MKKWFALLLALLLTVTCLVACGENSKDTNTESFPTVSESDKTPTVSESDKTPAVSESDKAPATSEEEEDSDKSSETLTPETIVGEWEGEYKVKEGNEVMEANVTVTFGKGGDFKMHLDEESMEEMYWKAFEGYTLDDVRDLIFSSPDQQELFDKDMEKLIDDGWTEEELVEENLKVFIASLVENLEDETGTYEMTVKGVLRMNGEKQLYIYENGTLSFSEEEDGRSYTMTLKKK